MTDATIGKLLQLLRPETALELRQAAALLLGEVGSRDDSLTKALCNALDDPEPAFRLPVLRSVAKLRIDRALPRLLEIVSHGGTEAEAAAQAAAALGAKGTNALREFMHGAAPGLRRRIAGALGAGGTTSADTAAVDALLDADPGVVDAATRTLIAKVPTLDARHRRALADYTLELLKDKKAKRRPASEAALLRLLAALQDGRGEAIFWVHTDPKFSLELRAAALHALGGLAPPSTRDRIARLLESAVNPDFRVAAPALMILRNVPVSDRALGDWLPLLEAPDVAARRFAIEKLRDRDNAALAAALVRQLQHPDRALRDAALAELGRTDAGRAALVNELLGTPTPESAWMLARAQAPFAVDFAAKLRSQLLAQACRWLDDSDRRAEPLFFLLREGDARQVRDWTEERGIALRKKKKYAGALAYFRLLTRDPACGEVVRFEATGCALKLSNHDLAADARNADPALHQFGALLHRHETEPIRMVEKAKWLDADDLLYLGFHFAEGARAEKEFGSQVLKLIIKRSPRSKQARDARSKLRSQGLE